MYDDTNDLALTRGHPLEHGAAADRFREPPFREGRGRYYISRLKADFRLAIISLFAVCSVSVITPFSIYRFAIGDIAIALIELACLALFIAPVVYAWRTGRSLVAGTVTAGLATAATMVIVLVLDLSPYWMFGALTANFLLGERRFALAASTVMIVATGMHGELFANRVEQASFVAVTVMISLYNLIFATQVENQRRQLNSMASRDPLTGALNRRAMNLDLATQIERFARQPEAVSVAIMDLDFFKRLNDRYGHEAGDRVLVKLVEVVQRRIRCSDRLYRFGGEEFVVLLPGADPRGLRVALNELREKISQEIAGPDGEKVTVSIGGAVLEADEDWPQWLARADAALLNAKRAGRDRIRISHATDLAPLDPHAATTMPAAG